MPDIIELTFSFMSDFLSSDTKSYVVS